MKVEMVGLSREFHSVRGRVAALRDVALEVDDGEFFVLLGPSGSGKSTLLNLIAGLEAPTSGQIRFGDDVVADGDRGISSAPRERNVAFVFQSYALYPHLSVFANIAFPLRIARWKPARVREAVERAAATLAISELLPARPRELSGGQRQRVAIARAIVRQPTVFLLDEPLSNLDAQLRTAMRVELKALQKKLDITTIYVTHDQVEALSLGDRIGVLRDGRLEQVGTARELYESPATPFVAQFIGAPPMNLIPARIAATAGGSSVVIAGQRTAAPAQREADLRRIGDAPFLLGIRPEHISMESPAGGGKLRARIASVEPLGRDTVVHLVLAAGGAQGAVSVERGECSLSVLSDREGLRAGQEVAIEFDAAHVHIFEMDRSRVPGADRMAP